MWVAITILDDIGARWTKWAWFRHFGGGYYVACEADGNRMFIKETFYGDE